MHTALNCNGMHWTIFFGKRKAAEIELLPSTVEAAVHYVGGQSAQGVEMQWGGSQQAL